MSPIGPYFQLNSPNNFSANRSVVFKSLYVIVLRLGKTFEDHVFQSNQLGSRVHIWTPERLEQWYGDRRDFLALLLSHATRARHALASLSPLFAWNTQKITPVLQATRASTGRYSPSSHTPARDLWKRRTQNAEQPIGGIWIIWAPRIPTRFLEQCYSNSWSWWNFWSSKWP